MKGGRRFLFLAVLAWVLLPSAAFGWSDVSVSGSGGWSSVQGVGVAVGASGDPFGVGYRPSSSFTASMHRTLNRGSSGRYPDSPESGTVNIGLVPSTIDQDGEAYAVMLVIRTKMVAESATFLDSVRVAPYQAGSVQVGVTGTNLGANNNRTYTPSWTLPGSAYLPDGPYSNVSSGTAGFMGDLPRVPERATTVRVVVAADRVNGVTRFGYSIALDGAWLDGETWTQPVYTFQSSAAAGQVTAITARVVGDCSFREFRNAASTYENTSYETDAKVDGTTELVGTAVESTSAVEVGALLDAGLDASQIGTSTLEPYEAPPGEDEDDPGKFADWLSAQVSRITDQFAFLLWPLQVVGALEDETYVDTYTP